MSRWGSIAVTFLIAAAAAAVGIFMPLAEVYHLWMPVAWAVLFATLVSYLPEFRNDSRPIGLALAFGAAAITLWLISIDLKLSPTKLILLKVTVEGFWAFGAVGVLAFAWSSTRRSWNWPLVCLTALGLLVAYYSGPRGGAAAMIDWFVRHFGWSHSSASLTVICLRKTIHFTFYGAVGLTAWSTARVARAADRAAIWFGLAVAALFACFDEGRQSFVAGRTSSIYDVLLDLAGAACFVAIANARYPNPRLNAQPVHPRARHIDG